MTINAGSVAAGNVELVGPQSQRLPVTFVSFDPASGNAVYTYQKNWNYLDTGTWSFVSTAAMPVLDDVGNPVATGTPLGDLVVNISTPADTTPPLASPVSVSPTPITTAGAQTVTLTVQYTDV